MAERLKYVSPEYQQRLDNLAGSLLRRHIGDTALEDTVEIPVITDQLVLDIPDNVVIGEE